MIVALATAMCVSNASARSLEAPSERTLGSAAPTTTAAPSLKHTTPDDTAELEQESPGETAIEETYRKLQCAKYARLRSGIDIMGNARKWWTLAIGKYKRDKQPALNAVMVLGGTKHGHVAVVTEIRSEREILVDHANWLNDGKVQKSALVMDVSAKNDWSKVRVWYPPINDLGTRGYPVYGFILQNAAQNAEAKTTAPAAPTMEVSNPPASIDATAPVAVSIAQIATTEPAATNPAS